MSRRVVWSAVAVPDPLAGDHRGFSVKPSHHNNPQPRITEEMMALHSMLEKGADADIYGSMRLGTMRLRSVAKKVYLRKGRFCPF